MTFPFPTLQARSGAPAQLTRRQLLQAGGAGLLAAVAPSLQAQISGLPEAINKAGRQRMLSQRLAKAWLAMGQNIEPWRAERVLQESMALFDRELIELKVFAPTPEIRATYAALEPVWNEYKTMLVGTGPDKGAVPRLVSLDARVLQLAQQGTAQLEKHSGKPVGRLVNMAGRQRMLSQRTAKYFLVQSWNLPLPEARAELDTARAEFARALQQLHDAPEATPAIRTDLQLARTQWVFFENALSNGAEPAGNQKRATEVFASSENLLDVMDRVASQYARLTA